MLRKRIWPGSTQQTVLELQIGPSGPAERGATLVQAQYFHARRLRVPIENWVDVLDYCPCYIQEIPPILDGNERALHRVVFRHLKWLGKQILFDKSVPSDSRT